MEGVCSRMDGLQAAILNVKLPHLAAWTEARRRIAGRYDRLLKGVGDIITPKVAPDRDHVYHLYVIRTEKRDALRKRLTDAGIATVLNYPKALPFYPAYAYLRHVPEDFPNAYANQSRILSLPIFPEMSKEMIAYVVEHIERFFADLPAGVGRQPEKIAACSGSAS
jgi:dTDP-4-amino-4,6-dideoxygalactose transaminase